MVGRVHTALCGQQPSGSCAHPIRESTGTLAKIPCNLRDFFFLCSEMGRSVDQRCHGAQTSGAWYILSKTGKASGASRRPDPSIGSSFALPSRWVTLALCHIERCHDLQIKFLNGPKEPWSLAHCFGAIITCFDFCNILGYLVF